MEDQTHTILAVAKDGTPIRRATRAELPGILAVQHDAFGRVAQMHGIEPERLSPLRETRGDLELLFDEGVVFFVAVASDGAIAGTVRASVVDSTVEIGRLAVSSDHLRLGVASALMEALESSFPDARRFELFTGAGATVPLALYTGRGYRLFREEEVEGTMRLVWLEKNSPGSDSAVYTDAHD